MERILGSRPTCKKCAAYCKQYGKPWSGKKRALLERVRTIYNSNHVNEDGADDNRGIETLLLAAGITADDDLDEEGDMEEEEVEQSF